MGRFLAILFVAVLGVADARADARMCIGNDVLQFGNRPVGTRTVMRVAVSSCGTESWSFTDVSVHPATGPAFTTSTDCIAGNVMTPGSACNVDVAFAPVVAGETSGGLWLRNTSVNAAAELVSFYGRGTDALAGTATLTFEPAAANFGAQPIGVQSEGMSVAVRNNGPATLTFSRLLINGPAAYDYEGWPDLVCREGQSLPAGQACMVQFFFIPRAKGARLANFVIDSPQLASLVILYVSGTGIVTGSSTVPVVEFYHAALDHYFITWMPDEIAGLDAGTPSKGWGRTGFTFKTWPAPQPGTTPVCRYYIPPAKGDSHFFGRGTAECDATGKKNPSFVLEDAAFMQMVLPDAGVCPAGTTPVYRVFSNRPDANHRYTTSRTVRDQMVAKGWLAEGDGPDLVVMCAPS